ncbi:12017_t:CDS:2, partial [Cetraspora pellucida]
FNDNNIIFVIMELDGESHKRLSSMSNRSIGKYHENGIRQIDPLKMTSLYHIKKAKHALSTLKTVVNEPDWRKIFEHNSGVVVCMKQDTSKNEIIPLIKGELNIQGFTPTEIFSVIQSRDIWDDWYEGGCIIERLSESINLTYTVMKRPFKSRDLSVVENFECSKNGTIYYASTSVDTLKTPSFGVGNREKLKLGGWILKSISNSPLCTKVVYVIQMKGWTPVDMFKIHLSKRPLVINTIKKYLQNKNNNFTPPPRSSSLQNSKQESNFNGNDVAKNRHRSRPSSLGDIKEQEEENMEQTIADFPIPPERNIPSEPSFEKPIVSKHGSQDLSELIKGPGKPHDYYNAAQKALELLKLLADNWDGWGLYAESKGVKIYQKDNGKPMPYLRGDATIYGGFHPADILSYINNLDARKLWDDRYEDGSIIERYSLDGVIIKMSMKGTFPFSGRDFIIIGITERDPVTGTIWVASTSIVDPRVPENKKYVRGNLIVAGWVLRPNFDGEKIVSVDITYIVDIDLKITSIPQSILNMMSTQTPLCIAKINDSLQKIGFPPYILRASGLIKNTAFNIKTFQYDATISIDGGTIIELRMSKKMYPNGFDISVQLENANVESLNDGEVVRITVPNGTETLHINVKKNTKGTQNTFRGKKFATSEEIDPISKSSKRPKSHRKDDTNKNTASQTNDESVASNNKNQKNIVVKLPKVNHDKVIPKRTDHKWYNVYIPPPPRHSQEGLGFNTKELTIIFVLMLFAYYSGKLSISWNN